MFSGAITNFNATSWRRLNEDQRRRLLRAAAVMSAETTIHYYGELDLDTALKRGVKLLQADTGLVKKWQGLFEKAKTAEALADLCWREAYRKIDVKDNGMAL